MKGTKDIMLRHDNDDAPGLYRVALPELCLTIAELDDLVDILIDLGNEGIAMELEDSISDLRDEE